MATRTIRKQWLVDDVLTSVTTAKMSDPDGNYGVKESVSGDIITADGVAMTEASTGIYEHSFTDEVGIAYTAYVEIVYDGGTHHFEIDVPARAAEAGLESDWDSLRAEIADYLGWTRDSSVWDATETARLASIIKSALLQVYYPMVAETGAVYEWFWMKPTATIETVKPYDTGTITIASGVVTLVDGTFVSAADWAQYGEIEVNGSIYTVASYDSTTQLTLDDTSVDVTDAASYSLSQSVYPLPATFGGAFDGPLSFAPGINEFYPPVEIISNNMLRRLRQNDITAEWPRYAATRALSFDPLVGTRYEIEFYPTPNEAWTLHGRYKVEGAMIDSTNKYPLGGVPMSEVIIESCLAVAEQRINDFEGTRIHTEKFQALLAAAIANDAQEHAPHTLGYNRDRSDHIRADRIDQHCGVAIHSFEGNFYYD